MHLIVLFCDPHFPINFFEFSSSVWWHLPFNSNISSLNSFVMPCPFIWDWNDIIYITPQLLDAFNFCQLHFGLINIFPFLNIYIFYNIFWLWFFLSPLLPDLPHFPSNPNPVLLPLSRWKTNRHLKIIIK